MTRRRWPALLVLALVIAALLVAADVIARTVAERRLAERLASEVPTATSTSVRIRSFPFLVRLAGSSQISEVDVSVAGAEARGLRFDVITADLRGVDLDRSELLRRGRVVIRDIERGTVRAVVTEEAVSELTGVPIHLGQDRVSVTVFGQEIGASLAVRDGRLVIGATGVSLPGLDLVAPLLPCVPDAEILPGRLELSCEDTDVPAELLRKA